MTATPTILGTIGTVAWCIQLIPQIYMNWKRKDTNGLPFMMMFLWVASAPPFGAYAIIQNYNTSLIIQPNLFCCLALFITGTLQVTGRAVLTAPLSKWSLRKTTAAIISFAMLGGGLEAMFVFSARPAYNRGLKWPTKVIGGLAAVLLEAGFLPPYIEIWKRRGRVVGISFLFLFIDWCGAFFSLLSLVTEDHFDILGGVLYSICMFLEIGIVLCHITWLLRTYTLRKQAKADGVDVEQAIIEHESKLHSSDAEAGLKALPK